MAEQSRGGRRLSLSRETLRDLEPSRELAGGVRGGSGSIPPNCWPTGYDPTGTTRLSDACTPGGGGANLSAACKGTVKVTQEIELNLSPSSAYTDLQEKILALRQKEIELDAAKKKDDEDAPGPTP